MLVRSIEAKLRVALNISPYHRAPRHWRFIKVARTLLKNREQMFSATRR